MIISIFAPKRGNCLKEGDYSRDAIISNISLRRSCPKYFVLLYQAIKVKVKYINTAIEKTVKKNSLAFVTIQL